ncbi:DUF4870 domain-containing protein [Roseiconus lacunae]|uniref:DUF4870 domain-containing protein n=1 Tax=Roseiconus lacunae TaxID=2605694 RepID=A0ABT7PHN6_9BACT|nr:DUF4870 domain-containing protein [Roseiconus lacunae]MCD0458781.1 DUF4870 domain-containing protein [Roseiconus lacunae]MDM4015761.1 DUF4870 domain-containing protein [Roseiconus lacunae]WRQ52366.1 DUF4870 domain-containing protein [Stieleria sp. HD01]
MTVTDELNRLQQLRDQGSLTEAEFDEAKRRVLNENSGAAGNTQHSPTGYGAAMNQSQDGMVHGIDEKTYCTLMHLSQLLIFSMLGVIVPIAMWLIGKEQSDLVRRHGNRMMNWLISELIYGMVIGVLCFFFIGILLIPVLAVVGILFPILAAIKANNNILWSYPGAIRFFDED